MKDASTGNPALNIGDSIGLVALVLALIALTISPPVWLKVIFLTVAIACLILCIAYSKWTYGWDRWKKFLICSFLSAIFLWVGVSQAFDQFRSGRPSWSLVEVRKLFYFLETSATTPWVQRTFCAVIGALFTLSVQAYWRSLTKTRADKLIQQLSTQPKGLFDYKLQAEDAIKQLGRVVDPISRIIGEVGASLDRHTTQIKLVSALPTRFQVRAISRAAIDLNRYSRRLTIQLPNLEGVSNAFAEGLPGWLRSLSAEQRQAIANSGLAHSLVQMVDTLTTNVTISAHYLTAISGARGISQQLNDAIEEHGRVISAIKLAHEKIRLSCILALSILTDDQK